MSSCFWPDDKPSAKGNSTDVIKMYTDRVEGFKRPAEMVEGEPNLWGKKGILPVGVRQGSLGDCWLLAACSALAEKPERVRRVFGNKDYPKSGIFQINLFYKGEIVRLNVDDKLPVDSKGNLINSKMSENDAWWNVILEKAFAKLNVNYLHLNGGVQT